MGLVFQNSPSSLHPPDGHISLDGAGSDANANTLSAAQHHDGLPHLWRRSRSRPRHPQARRVKPERSWDAGDLAEGRALAQSDVKLPGEELLGQASASYRYHCYSHHACASNTTSAWWDDNDNTRHPARSSSSSSSRSRRPPSLERQDAFRDARTAKRRRRRAADGGDEVSPAGGCRDSCFRSSVWSPAGIYCDGEDDGGGYHLFARLEEREHDDAHAREAREVDELYRLGLLYDDEQERGAAFSLDQIVREEPVYSVRVRPAKRRAQVERVSAASSSVSLAVDLAFSAFGDDEALAAWILSSQTEDRTTRDAAVHDMDETVAGPPRAAVHGSPVLTVIYELADTAAAATAAADDFFGSVSEVSYSIEEDEDELTWALVDGCNNGTNEDATAATTAAATVDAATDDGDEVDPWVVLGLDGS